MRNYELMVVLPVEDELREAGKQKLTADLESQGVVIEKADDMGDRDLAYEVQKRRRGHYILYTIKVDGPKIALLDKSFKLNNNLLRYLFVKL
jgi:small subunit ribosomal protein S6